MTRRPDPHQLGLFAPATDPGPATATVAPPATASAVPTGRRFLPGPLPDADARARIRADLGTNLLVEAGAGSGKTTALVDRMVALVRTGAATVDAIAAVTFTRKAAAELRQRFQTGLESEAAAARRAGEDAAAARLDQALRAIDRGFIGTIHSFCARLLRERPVEAGLDPAFRELMGADEVRLRSAFWRSHLERLAAADDPLVAELAAVGLAPSRLRGLFDELAANPDVRFPADEAPAPMPAEIDAVRRALDDLIRRGTGLMPAEPPEKGWDDMQRRLRLLRFHRRVVDWADDATFLDLLGEEFHGRGFKVTKNRWPDGDAARSLEADWRQLRDGDAATLLDRWWAHRYPIALRFAGRAADAFAEERRRNGTLDFQDLLMLAARLLRENDDAREALGDRYRRLLVDEFQDTDPVQAEVLLLLASPADGRPWQRAEPRPGALFVVGDPKQSIYRFRRADIAVYNLVRERFDRLGAVIELVANFRSVPAIGAMVDEVFGGEDGIFPARATPHQAAFAPLRTRRDPEAPPPPAQYLVDPDGRSRAASASDGASRLVPWIAGEVRAGRRAPGDFLVLARQKADLATYARLLEAWGVPVQVTGAGVDQAEELSELILLMEALADPTDPVRVVAVLVGLFFGLDHEALVAWTFAEDLEPAARAGARRRFDITIAPDDGTPVADALRTLNGWWRAAQRTPADVLVSAIVDRLGIVPLAAARELGELRAGSILFALDALRRAALDGDTSLAAATDALRTALESDEAEAPLQPVRRGVARVMTLHQAKGLEAPVVCLVQPAGSGEHPVVRHVERGPEGAAVGYLVVQEKDGYRTRVVARPAGWEAKEAEERRFEAAEQDRLLYVAATRAEDRLVVARRAGAEAKSPWAGLYGWLGAHGETLRLEPRTAPEPRTAELTAAELRDRTGEVDRRRIALAEPGYSLRTATGLARSAGDGGGPGSGQAAPGASGLAAAAGPADAGSGPASEEVVTFRGRAWGSAVHGALDAAARGAAGDRLRSVCRALLLQEERPTAGGEPTELDELVGLVESVLGSGVWRRARAADRVLSEVPFAYHAPAGTAADLPGRGAGPMVLEGVVDLAFRERDGWVLVDYKTDAVDAMTARRRDEYVRQVDIYARVWAELTGEPVKERMLFFTASPERPLVW